MKFLHHDPDIVQAMEDVSRKLSIPAGQIEKDYWITHILWSLQHSGLEIWFKGGTCLSKGYSIVRRFSEDLDLKFEAGTALVPPTPNWKGEKSTHIQQRKEWFQAIPNRVEVPDCTWTINTEMEDSRARSIVYELSYPGHFVANLGPVIRPFIRLEVGSARVIPFLDQPITSWLHEHAQNLGFLSEYIDNRPHIRCIHPLVTLIEKIDAMMRRWPRSDLEAVTFIRHYEDAAAIIEALGQLPPVGCDLETLLSDMLVMRQIRELPRADHPAFQLGRDERSKELRRAYASIAGMFWAERVSLEEACGRIRAWIQELRNGDT